MIPTQELIEDGFHRTYFCEREMEKLDNKVIQHENVLGSDECTFTFAGQANRQNFY